MHKSLSICLGETWLHFSNISKVIEGGFSEITDMRFKIQIRVLKHAKIYG